jgi:hypothetical protein
MKYNCKVFTNYVYERHKIEQEIDEFINSEGVLKIISMDSSIYFDYDAAKNILVVTLIVENSNENS